MCGVCGVAGAALAAFRNGIWSQVKILILIFGQARGVQVSILHIQLADSIGYELGLYCLVICTLTQQSGVCSVAWIFLKPAALDARCSWCSRHNLICR
jgi:hypothetical protein